MVPATALRRRLLALAAVSRPDFFVRLSVACRRTDSHAVRFSKFCIFMPTVSKEKTGHRVYE